MTLAEFERRQWAWLKSREDREKEVLAAGWWSAAFDRQPRLTPLKTLLTPAVAPSEEEQAKLAAQHKRLEEEMG